MSAVVKRHPDLPSTPLVPGSRAARGATKKASAVEVVLYDDEDGTDLLIDDQHNVNFVPRTYERFITHTARDGSPMRVEIHPTLRTWYVEVQR